MNETRVRSGFFTVLVVTFPAIAPVTGGMFLMTVLSACSEQSPTITPPQADEHSSNTPEMTIPPELTLTLTQDTIEPSSTSEQEPIAAKGSGLGSRKIQIGLSQQTGRDPAQRECLHTAAGQWPADMMIDQRPGGGS